MPLAPLIRRWLWRANGVLGLVVLLVGVWALRGTSTEPAAIDLGSTPVRTAVAPPDGPEFTLAEIEALSRPFHPWGTSRTRPVPAPAEPDTPADGRPPLRAYRIASWIRDTAGPDLVVLRCQDPAHPKSYFPREGEPDGGIEVQAIQEMPWGARVTLRRGDETAVLDFRTELDLRRGPVRLVPATTASGSRGAPDRPDALAARPPDVKLVPFYGADGKLAGGRVTGVRPGSALAEAGLRAGDVIVAAGEAPVHDLQRLHTYLRASAGSLHVQTPAASSNGGPRQVTLGV